MGKREKPTNVGSLIIFGEQTPKGRIKIKKVRSLVKYPDPKAYEKAIKNAD